MTGLEIQRVLALRGPNVWTRFPVLEAWVDLGPLKDAASNEIPGFNDRLRAWLPGLVEHRCSEGERGGFFQRLDRGTYLGHIFEHVVLELQTAAGVEVGYGKTRMTGVDGVYKVAIEYADEELGKAACEFGRELCLAAVHDTPIDVPAGIAKLRAIREANALSPVVTDLLAAAKAHGVPAQILDPCGLVQLGYGSAQHKVLNGLTDRASGVGASVAVERDLTRPFLRAAGVPVPPGRTVKTADEAWEVAQEVGLPVVLRPKYPSKVETRRVGPLSDETAVRSEFERVYNVEWWTPMVDPLAPGEEYRLLMVGGKLVSALALDADGRDATDRMHPAVVERAADAAFALKLDVASVEILTTDPGRPLEEVNGFVLDVAAAPNLGPFLEPVGGPRRPVGKAVVESLFADGKSSRVPVVAVTGTNGKTTTTRLTAHLLGRKFGPVGMTCTEGVYVSGRRIMSGDCSGPKSAKVILRNPLVGAAVLETARGGILREGLGFDRCSVSVVTNIDDGDHLGTSDVDTPEALADVKSTIVWATAKWGTAVLNAADPLVVGMRQYCDGSAIFFARDGSHPVLTEHRAAGGRTVFVRNGMIVFAEGERETEVAELARVPLTHGGRVPFQVENALASAAAAWASGVPTDDIRVGLETFSPGLDNLPARFNVLDLAGVTVVLDYGHNVSALARILPVLGELPHGRRHAVYSAAGDRRDQDIVDQGRQLGGFFDRVVLYEDTYLRGREPGAIFALFRRGIAAGDRTREIEDIRGGMEAIEVALAGCKAGDLLYVQPDLIDSGVTLLKTFLSRGGREITMNEAAVLANPKSAPVAKAAAGAGVEVRDSRFGLAAHAGRPFRRGELIVKGWGPITTERAMHTIQVDVDCHIDPPDPIRYLNHSCEPNCGFLIRTEDRVLEVHALRDIDADEELTVDYETFEAEITALVGPCLCNASGCRGTLVGYAGLPAERREALGRYVAEYLREADVPQVVAAQVG